MMMTTNKVFLCIFRLPISLPLHTAIIRQKAGSTQQRETSNPKRGDQGRISALLGYSGGQL
jgi:hypothetical protein